MTSTLGLLLGIPRLGTTPRPVIDLNGPASGTSATATYTEGDGFAGDVSAATLTYAGGDSIGSLVMTCGGAWGDDGADESIQFDTWVTDSETDLDDTLVVGGTTFRLAYVASTGVLTITNNADDTFPTADGQALIRLFEYENAATPPTEGDRTFSWVADTEPVEPSAPEADAFRIRRSSDSTEDDYTLTEVDDGTLDTFVGAGDGCVATWKDLSGNGNDVTQATTTAQPKLATSGAVNDGVVFDGTDDRLSLGARGTSGSITALTVAVFVKTTSSATMSIVSEYVGATNNRSWSVGTLSGKLQARMSADGLTSNFKDYRSTTSINDGNWHHIAVVFDAGVLTLYVDGIEDTPIKAIDATVTIAYDSASPLQIGAENTAGSANRFNGSLSNIFVAQSALSAPNIATLATGASVGTPLLWLPGNYTP